MLLVQTKATNMNRNYVVPVAHCKYTKYFNESGVKVCKFKARQLGITATQESQLGGLGLPPGPSFSKSD